MSIAFCMHWCETTDKKLAKCHHVFTTYLGVRGGTKLLSEGGGVCGIGGGEVLGDFSNPSILLLALL